jgi:hypothetical protein
MQRKRPVVGDQDNTQFVVPEPDTHHASAGFQAGDDSAPHEAARRFPHRRPESEVPKQTLATRLAEGRGEKH